MENGKTLESILALAQLTQTDTILWVVNFGFIITECRSLYWITPNNRHFHTTFEGKKRIKVSLIITVHSVVTTCVSIPCIAHPMSYPPEHGDQVRALAAVMYRSVTNWVIIRAHKHPFIVVIGLILHPSSILRRGSSDCKYNCFGCTRRAVAGSVANVSLFTVLDTLSYIHNTPALLNPQWRTLG